MSASVPEIVGVQGGVTVTITSCLDRGFSLLSGLPASVYRLEPVYSLHGSHWGLFNTQMWSCHSLGERFSLASGCPRKKRPLMPSPLILTLSPPAPAAPPSFLAVQIDPPDWSRSGTLQKGLVWLFSVGSRLAQARERGGRPGPHGGAGPPADRENGALSSTPKWRWSEGWGHGCSQVRQRGAGSRTGSEGSRGIAGAGRLSCRPRPAPH